MRTNLHPMHFESASVCVAQKAEFINPIVLSIYRKNHFISITDCVSNLFNLWQHGPRMYVLCTRGNAIESHERQSLVYDLKRQPIALFGSILTTYCWPPCEEEKMTPRGLMLVREEY
jgi:hypothetical protein